MRTGVVGFALALLVLAPLLPRAASAQFSFDARRIGMGGVSLSRDGNARRYNPAYHAVKNKNQVTGAPKFSIPVPLGLISVIVSESWESTTQPSGSGTARPALEAEVGVVGDGDDDGTGLGEPAGDGLDSCLMSLAAWLLECAEPTAITVPTPAITSTSTTTMAMITSQGVRWTGGWTAPLPGG